MKRFTRPAPTSQRCGKEKAELNFSPRARIPNLASSLSLGCQDLMTDPHFSFLNFLITFPLVRRVSFPRCRLPRAAAFFPITFSRTRPQFLLPAIYPTDRRRARHQRVCPGRDRRRISLGVALDDCSERRNICVRARVARTQPPRCTPNRRLKNRETRDCLHWPGHPNVKCLDLTPIFSHE